MWVGEKHQIVNLNMSNKCETCGTPIIDDCPVCGAPQCCPKCCEETTKELFMSRKTADYDYNYVRDAMDYIAGEVLWVKHFPKQCCERIRIVCEKVKNREPLPFQSHDDNSS